MTFDRMILNYLETIKQSKSENTCRIYTQSCYAFKKWLEKQGKDIHDMIVLSEDKAFFSPVEQVKYADYLRATGCAETTLKLRMVVLKQLLTFCADKGYVACDCFVPNVITRNLATVSCIDKKDAMDIYAIASELDETDSYVTVRTKLSILLTLLCGFKVSELCDLRLDDLDVKNRAVSTNGIIKYIFNENIIPNLNFYLTCRTECLAVNEKEGSDYLFINKYGDKITPHDLTFSYRRFCDERGLSKSLSFSAMRNLCIRYYGDKLSDNTLVAKIFDITQERIKQLKREISKKEIV